MQVTPKTTPWLVSGGIGFQKGNLGGLLGKRVIAFKIANRRINLKDSSNG